MAATLETLRNALRDRYEIIRELGQGGMAIVYLARDLRHDRHVAIKVMRPEVSASSNTQRFLREIKVAARLQHPHILAVHDSGTAGDALYYVMPYVEGESVRERLTKGQMPITTVVEIAREVADALDYAHSQGIIHRDIKPENILLTAGRGHTGGHAVVADFGIARAMETPEGEATATATGIAVGSPAYMSPEQALGMRELDARTDIYSLGCVVYEMLTGEPPHGRHSARAAMAGHISSEPESVTGRRAHVPPNVLAAVERAMAKEPEDRFATAAEFRDAIKLDTATISVPITRATRVPRPPVKVAAAAGLLVAVAAIALAVRPGAGAPLKERAAVVIADADNGTGDQVFRHSLVTALTAGIGQSEHVTVVSRSRIAETLARMQRTATDTVVDERVAREVAVREGWGAVVVPSIAIFDSTYVITTRIIDPAQGTELATETVRARTKSDVIDAVDDLSQSIRRAFGESRLSVLRRSAPLPQVTTRSLDALEKYAAGTKAWDAGRMNEAREHFSGAIALDSNFALAHVAMGKLHYWQNRGPLGDKHFERALANVDRITDRERMWANAQMAAARGNWQLAATNYRAYLSRFPGYAPAWSSLGTVLMRDQRPRDALAAFGEFTKLDSTSGSAYINMATSYSQLARYDSAILVYRQAFTVRPEWETWFNLNHEYGMTLVKANNPTEARAVFAKMLARPTPSDQARGHRSMALLDLLGGHPSAAVPRLQSAIAMNASMKESLSEARNRLFLAAAYEMAGDAASARAEVDRTYQIFSAGYLDAIMSARIATALVRHGRVAQAARVVDSVRARVRGDNNYEQAHLLLAAAELSRARGAKDSARAYIEQAAVLDSSAEVLSPAAATRAETGDLDGAIAIQRRIRGHEGNVGYEAQFGWSLTRYHLGRLLERSGKPEEARKEYEAFLSEWAEAEPTIPAIVDSRARLKRLLALLPKREG